MKALIGLMVVGLAWGQSNPSVTQKVFTLTASGSDAAQYATVKNIGQGTHQLYGVISGGCNNSSTVRLYGNTADDTFGTTAGHNLSLEIALTSNVVGPPVTAPVFSTTGSGVYPKLIVYALVKNGCTLDLYYTGTLLGAAIGIQVVAPTDRTTFKVDGYNSWGSPSSLTSGDNPIWIAGTGESPFTGGVSAPSHIVACNHTASVSVTAGATTRLVTSGGPDSVIYVCGFAISGSAANTQAKFISGTQATNPCDTGAATVVNTLIIGQATTPFGSGLGTIGIGSAGKDLCLQATTGNVTGVLSYTQFDPNGI